MDGRSRATFGVERYFPSFHPTRTITHVISYVGIVANIDPVASSVSRQRLCPGTYVDLAYQCTIPTFRFFGLGTSSVLGLTAAG